MHKLRNELNNFIPEDADHKRDIDSFKKSLATFGEDLFCRENPAHICVAVWITNPSRTKSLLYYHIYMINFQNLEDMQMARKTYSL